MGTTDWPAFRNSLYETDMREGNCGKAWREGRPQGVRVGLEAAKWGEACNVLVLRTAAINLPAPSSASGPRPRTRPRFGRAPRARTGAPS